MFKSAIFFVADDYSSYGAPSMIFGCRSVLILVHYAWNVGTTDMRRAAYMMVAGALLRVIAAAQFGAFLPNAEPHIMRLDRHRFWLSWIGVSCGHLLAYSSFHFGDRLKRTAVFN